MTRDACRELASDLAMRAIGRSEPQRDPALDAHLEGCADCRAELDELRAVAGALRLLDADSLNEPLDAPSSLAGRVLAGVGGAISVRRRRRATILSAAAAVIFVAIGATALLVMRDDGTREGRQIAVAGSGPVTGSAVLVGKAWGTEVTVDLTGLDDDEMYWLWLTGADGERVAAGTLIGTGRDLHAVFASGISIDVAERIWMTDSADAIVFDEHLDRA